MNARAARKHLLIAQRRLRIFRDQMYPVFLLSQSHPVPGIDPLRMTLTHLSLGLLDEAYDLLEKEGL